MPNFHVEIVLAHFHETKSLSCFSWEETSWFTRVKSESCINDYIGKSDSFFICESTNNMKSVYTLILHLQRCMYLSSKIHFVYGNWTNSKTILSVVKLHLCRCGSRWLIHYEKISDWERLAEQKGYLDIYNC